MKIVCLGNEFVEGDSFAKEVGKILEEDFEVVNVGDSFQLMGILNDGGDFVLLDVVQGLKDACFLKAKDLKNDSIVSAHDFDVGYVLKLLEEEPRIIGIPVSGKVEIVALDVRALLKSS